MFHRATVQQICMKMGRDNDVTRKLLQCVQRYSLKWLFSITTVCFFPWISIQFLVCSQSVWTNKLPAVCGYNLPFNGSTAVVSRQIGLVESCLLQLSVIPCVILATKVAFMLSDYYIGSYQHKLLHNLFEEWIGCIVKSADWDSKCSFTEHYWSPLTIELIGTFFIELQLNPHCKCWVLGHCSHIMCLGQSNQTQKLEGSFSSLSSTFPPQLCNSDDRTLLLVHVWHAVFFFCNSMLICLSIVFTEVPVLL